MRICILYQLISDKTSVDAYTHRLHISIDHALAISYRRNLYDGATAFVAHIGIVKGIPFYGYHVGYKFFLKIYLYNPLHITRLADILRQGTIMKKAIQPYESHLQYLLQWMCDYNLYGCAYIDCSTVKFRSPVPDHQEVRQAGHHWHGQTIPTASISDSNELPRQSHCSIEVDICVQDITNRLEIKQRNLHHEFTKESDSSAPDEKLVHSMAGLWRDETRRRKARMGELVPGSSPFPPEVLVSVSADPRDTEPGGWIHEQEYFEKVRKLIIDEANNHKQNVASDNFVQEKRFESQVKTTYESVEDLFPANLTKLGPPPEIPQSNGQSTADCDRDMSQFGIEVDESRLLDFTNREKSLETDEDLDTEAKRSDSEQDDEMELNGGELINLQKTKNTSLSVGDCHSNSASQEASELENYRGPKVITSSSDLGSLGVRNVGDNLHFGDDTFEIPFRYASSINTATAQFKRAPLTIDDTPPLTKRQKVDDRKRLTEWDSDVQKGLIARQGPEFEGGVGASTFENRPLAEKDSLNVASESKSTMIQGEGSNHSIRRLSQNSGTINGVKANARLSFPVVKNPQDPHTIERLSQQGNAGSNKSSPLLKERELSSAGLEGQKSTMLQSSQTLVNHSAIDTKKPSSQFLKTLSQIRSNFDIEVSQKMLCLASIPPAISDLSLVTYEAQLPHILYPDAHYSDEQDIPERVREYAGKEFKLVSDTVPYLPDFNFSGHPVTTNTEKSAFAVAKLIDERKLETCKLRTWEIDCRPPTFAQVKKWLGDKRLYAIEDPGLSKKEEPCNDKTERSQVDGPTQRNQHGFKYSQKKESTSVQHETQYMSTMSLEVHVNTRGNLVPNPEKDQICCVFWCLQNDSENTHDVSTKGSCVGVIVLSETPGLTRNITMQTSAEVDEELTELGLINRVIDTVRHHDPDILVGYEVQGSSWGYIIERARFMFDYNLCDELSRVRSQSHGRFGKENDKWGFNQTSTIRVTGRHMINIWRTMRGELNLLQYTMENVVFHLLHRRIPHYSFQDLTTWYTSPKPRDLAKVIDYYTLRVQLDLEILEENELIPRTSEQARLLGIDFFSVFSRGSQFKVESLMFRIAKPENFVLISPSRKQVGQQNALECLPLVMEPQSAFFTSPLLVLDFQSLYPSVMIAYNYCYSTFLGRVVNWRGQNKMGFTEYKRQHRILELLKDHINIAPNGVVYVRPEIRKSLLAKMLGEILETRVMVKSGMKIDRDDKTLQRLLNNRQLALKLIANVTYGYTSASFSGRMPCSEIADSIVQTGRETLEKAIALIHSVRKWDAEVVYGDTDSLFVYLKGRSKEDAFKIGNDIAETVTKLNPRPVKLKFEKVYLPCVLLAKKRYVGFKYESNSQKEPDFDAKGIETVRRDGTPAEQKMEERALKILFRTADLSQVKRYFQRECKKILKGKVSIQDFCFAKEVRLGSYSEKGLLPPGAMISTKKMIEDPRAEPQYGERVPYVIITGAPGARLIDRCVAPEELLNNPHNELDAEYYISKNIIPPLERIFNLVGANVRQWYDEMPKFQRTRRIDASLLSMDNDSILQRKTMESYMKSSTCLVCQQRLEGDQLICDDCLVDSNTLLWTIRSRLSKAEKRGIALEMVCRSCAGFPWGEEVKCDSKDCAVSYTRARHVTDLGHTRSITDSAEKLLKNVQGPNLEW